MTPEAQQIYDDFKDCGDNEIIEAWHSEYFDNPVVKEALTALHISEHEVMNWIYLFIK